MANEQLSVYDLQQTFVQPVQLAGPHGDARGEAARLQGVLTRVAIQRRAEEARGVPTCAAATQGWERRYVKSS